MKLQLAFVLSFAAGATAAGTRLLAKKQVDSKDSKKVAVATFQPGNFSWGRYARDKNGNRVRLSNGLMGRAIAYVEDPVVFADGTEGLPLHDRADGAALIPKADGTGYYYVSNSETGNAEAMEFDGGVYVIETNLEHNPVDYYPVLQGTVDNCAGGATPWGTFVSCEEESAYGHCWQVDPANKDQTGPTKSEKTALTGYPGDWEAFAWDDNDSPPRGYVTDDALPEEAPDSYGTISRFTPDAAAMECYNKATKAERWCTLNSGTVDYLKLNPYSGGSNCGTISWVSDPLESSAGMYRAPEGADVTDRILRVVAKEDSLFFEIDLESAEYCQFSTLEGFPQEPDNVRFWKDTLYICTDGRTPNGIYGMNKNGFFGIVHELDYNTEAAGVDFTPDGKVMYMAFQEKAIWQFWREDGLPFHAKTNGITYGKDTGSVMDTEIALEAIIEGIAGDLIEEALEDL